MLPATETTIAPPYVPTLDDVQRRRASLLGLSKQSLRDPHPQPRLPDPDPPAPPRPPATFTLAEAALHGLAGDVVRTLAPHTEAHPAALLLQLLAVFGNLLGPAPHCTVDATRHSLNLFVVLVGESSKARKGASWSQIARLFAEVDHPWLSTCVTTARLTASGLAHTLRDQQPPTDRRLLALSEEFASILRSLKHGRSYLSPLLRNAWDNGHLPTINMEHPLQATGTHIALIAHITQRELAQYLPRTEAHNGFANRCLWTWVERSRCLPEGGALAPHDLSALAGELRRVLAWAAATPQLLFRRDDAARALWNDRYPALSQVRPGLRGAATSRAEAQVLRLSALYAALDATTVIGLPHLEAALAVWDYCSASATLLFGTSTGDPIADRIRDAIDASRDGLSKTQIRRLFHGHVDVERIDAALEQLVALDAIHCYSEATGGRPSTLWAPTDQPLDDQPSEEEGDFERF